MPRPVFILCLVLAFVAGAIFIIVNNQPLSVELLLARPTLSAGWWLIGMFAFGWILGAATLGRALLKARQKRKELRRKLRLAESELKVVRPQTLQS